MNTGERLHCIGIGGSGMAGLARMAAQAGMQVTGSDLQMPERVYATHPFLRDAAIPVVPHDAANVPEQGIVVYSKAIPPENVERAAAEHQPGVTLLSYGEAVMRFAQGKTLVAVAGTHGKSTTTAIIAHTLERAGRKPSFVLGAKVPSLNNQSARYVAESDVFVLEADEYDRTFHAYRPTIAVVTNMDWDHMDTYPSFADVRESFATFLRTVEDGGTIVYCADDERLYALIENDLAPELHSRHITIQGYGLVRATADAWHPVVPLHGQHAQLDALAAAHACAAVGCTRAVIETAFASFTGLERRMQHLGSHGDAQVYSDYAHHPTELRATLDAAASQFPGRTLTVVFQPHQRRRLTALYDDFVRVLRTVPRLHIVREFAVQGRDDAHGMKSAGDLANALRETNVDVAFHESIDDAASSLASVVDAQSVLLIIGAGNVHDLAVRLVTAHP